MGRKLYIFLGLLTIVLLSACGSQQGRSSLPPQVLLANKVNADQLPTVTPQIVIPRQVTTQTLQPSSITSATITTASVTATPTATTPTSTPTTVPPPSATPPTNIPGGGLGNSPYGPPPAITAAEVQLTQQLFGLINSDRAARGLYAFTWNATLSAGARQHAWDMVHCGFSHTCPSGLDQCTRIANEGFAGFTDCGENIGLAGPYPTTWDGVYNVQESMINEPPSGWHRIHLTSTTLHRAGVGLFIDSRGWVWFVEDMVS
ncbi:MAG: hypothetical protein NVS4B11_01340 [Ktedonobacteraceae bacterium]